MDQSRAVELLASPIVTDRVSAAEWLSQQPQLDDQTLLALLDAVGDSEESVREWSVSALESAQPSADVQSQLVSRLSHSADDVVYWSITLLGRLGSEASNADDALAKLLGDESSPLANRERAAWALGKTGVDSADAAAIQKAAQSEHPRLASLAQKLIDSRG